MRRTARVLLTTIKPIPKSGRPAEKSRDEHYCRSGSHHRGCNPAYVFQIPMYLKAAHNAFVRSHQHHDCHHRSGYDTIDDCTPDGAWIGASDGKLTPVPTSIATTIVP